MKHTYVALMWRLRAGLRRVGLLPLLDRAAGRSRTALWVRSWLSIYDLQDMVRLDVPWWTLESADRVAAHLARTEHPRAFEWGSGASTVWLGNRGAEVVSVEHDADWAESMRPVLPDTALLEVVPPTTGSAGVRSGKAGFEGLDFTDYVAAIDGHGGEFDLVVIDGRAREACLGRALPRLASGGVIVFDNVDRARYRRAIEAVGDRVVVEWTRGRTPSLPYPTRTALIRRAP